MRALYYSVEFFIGHQNWTMSSFYCLDLGSMFFYLRILRILAIWKPRFSAKNSENQGKMTYFFYFCMKLGYQFDNIIFLITRGSFYPS